MRKKTILILVLIILLGTFLRVYDLGEESLWMDEGYTLQTITYGDGSLGDVYDRIIHKESCPPFYYVFMFGWTGIFGFSEFSLRFPSVIFGALSIWLAFLCSTAFFLNQKKGEIVGLIFAFLMAVSVPMITFSQEARAYSLFVFYVLGCTYLFLEFWKKRDKTNLIFYLLATLLMAWVHYFAIFVVLAHMFFLFAIKDSPPIRFTPLLPFLTWIILLPQIITNNNFIKLIGFKLGLWMFIIPCVLLFILAVIIQKRYGLIEKIKIDTYLFWIIFIVFICGGTYLTVILMGTSFIVRYTLFTLPFLYFLIAWGIEKANDQLFKVACICLIILFSMLTLQVYYQEDIKEQWEGAADYISEFEQCGDSILLIDEDLEITFRYYYQGNSQNILRCGETQIYTAKTSANMTWNEEQWDELETDGLFSSNRIWFIDSHNYRSGSFWYDGLQTIGVGESRVLTDGIKIYLYKRHAITDLEVYSVVDYIRAALEVKHNYYVGY